MSSRDGTCLQLVEDRRAVIVRSKVERPLTIVERRLNYHRGHSIPRAGPEREFAIRRRCRNPPLPMRNLYDAK